MIESTWKEEPKERPSFTDIVNFLYNQNIEDIPIDETDYTAVDSENDSGYLDLSVIIDS